MRNRSILSFLFIFTFLCVQAQVKYTIQLERPTSVSDSELTDLFKEYGDIRQVQVSGNRLVLTVPSEEDYPISAIRDILAEKQVAAVEYNTQPGTFTNASKKNLETVKLKVYGNCGMCKDRIERAARSVKGVVMASWNEDSQQLVLKYLPAKTGAAIRKQVPVVVDNLLKVIDHKEASNHNYNGYSSCPLVTGYGKMVLAEFDYNSNFTPDPKLKRMLVFNSDKEHWRLWMLKKYMLPKLYWDKMLKGKEV